MYKLYMLYFLSNIIVSHFRKCGFEKWDSMISLMWDSTLVSQKCVVGLGLWTKHDYWQGFSVVMQYKYKIAESFVWGVGLSVNTEYSL